MKSTLRHNIYRPITSPSLIAKVQGRGFNWDEYEILRFS